MGGVKPLLEVPEFQVPRHLHVEAKLLLCLKLVEEILSLGDGLIEVGGPQRLDDVSADARHLQAGLVGRLFPVGPRVEEDRAVAQPMAVFVIGHSSRPLLATIGEKTITGA